MIKKILAIGSIIGFMAGAYLIGLTVGEYNAYKIAYRIDHLEKRIGKLCVKNQEQCGFSKAMAGGK